MEEISSIVKKQHEFFATGATKDIAFRIEQLKRLKTAIKSNEELLYDALKKDLGKSKVESYMTEIGFTYGEINHMIGKLSSWSRPQKMRSGLVNFDARSWIQYEPFGVVLVMAPWNYPFQLVMAPVAGALAAGNCIIIKSADYSKNTSDVLKKIISESFHPSYINVFTGDRSVNQAVLEQRYDLICFTGSPSLGRIVMEKAARHLTPVILELGGKSPCIVDEDADIDLAAKRIAFGKYLNAGQTCIAPDYLYVHEKIKHELIERIRFHIHRMYGDDPHASPDFGRIINARQYERIKRLLAEGVIVEGGQTNDDERYISPTIIDDITTDNLIMKEEIFGPVFPVMTFSQISEVISFVSSGEKPLALYYFSQSRRKQREMLLRTSSGGVCINDTIMHITNPHLPFGGVGSSGTGQYHGYHSFKVFSHAKPVLKKTTLFDLPLRYAPYREIMMKLAKLIFE